MPDAAEPSCVPEEAAPLLCAAYGFGEVVVGERLHGGYANDLFRIVADGDALVLRLKHPPVIEEDIAWEHRLTGLLSRRLPEVVAPLRARNGDTLVRLADRVGWLVRFVAGEAADAARCEHRLAAARALGRLHRAGEGLRLSRRPRLDPIAALEWPAPVVPAELEEWGETIARARAWAIDLVAIVARTRSLPKSLIHGDFFPGNVLVAGDRVAGIVDWEEAQADWLTWDLANAIGTFCSVGDDLDAHASRDFVEAYRTAGGTARAADDDLLVPFVAAKRILEVLRAPTDRQPRWNHQRANLRSLARLGVAGIPPDPRARSEQPPP